MILTNRLVSTFVKNNLNKFKAIKSLKPIVIQQQKQKTTQNSLSTPISQQRIPHSWGQYYFTPFILPFSLLASSMFTSREIQFQLVNLTTGSLLIPFVMTNFLFYNTPFKSESKSNIYKIVNALALGGITASFYFCSSQPLIPLSVSLGANFLTGLYEFYTRRSQQKQKQKEASISLSNDRIEGDVELDVGKLRESRMKMMLVVFRVFSAIFLLLNLTLCLKLEHYKGLESEEIDANQVGDNSLEGHKKENE